jgi:hypothetical protein
LSDEHHETERLATLLRQLCEAELVDDEFICHDGGFRYSGDFMTMEQELLEPTSLLDDVDYRHLLELGYVEEIEPSAGRSAGFRVTDRGRALAFDS